LWRTLKETTKKVDIKRIFLILYGGFRDKTCKISISVCTFGRELHFFSVEFTSRSGDFKKRIFSTPPHSTIKKVAAHLVERHARNILIQIQYDSGEVS